MNEGVSKRASPSPKAGRLTTTKVSTISVADKTNSSRKKLRQPNALSIAPPTVGPTLGANPSAMPAMPIAVACLPGGNFVMQIVWFLGMSRPTETACNMRPSNIEKNSGATKSSNDPAANNPKPSNMY